MKGQVRAYQISNNNVWLQLGSNLDGLELGDGFGTSVALSADGSVLVIGAPKRDSHGHIDSGEVTTYQYSNSTWNQLGSRLGGEVATDWFGVEASTVFLITWSEFLFVSHNILIAMYSGVHK